jgi:branched-chain amino acid transport system permease protein
MKNSKKAIVQRLMQQIIFIAIAYAIVSVLMAAGVINGYVGKLMTTASIYVIVALGVNLVTGMTGQLVLGHAGFMAIGAYSSAIFLSHGFPMLPAIILAALMTAVIGLIVGALALRLRGDYLAIVTLGFGEIIKAVLQNLDKLTGGASGMMNIRSISITFGNPMLANFLWVGLFMVLAVVTVVHLLTSSHGRAIISVRDDEIASESMGINIYYTKLYAFVFSTFLAGVGGALFASHYGYLNPDTFGFLKSMDFLIIVVFGGLGSITGTVLASYVVVLLQEMLRGLQNYRLVIYPLLLILMMIFRPQGLLGIKELSVTSLFVRKTWTDLWAKLKKPFVELWAKWKKAWANKKRNKGVKRNAGSRS